MPTQIEGENTAAIAQNSAAIASLVHALAVETARARSAETAANVHTDVSVAGLSSALEELDVALRAYVNEHAASGMTYKGSVSKVSTLPSSGNSVGDMYNVVENGHNYVWTGRVWDDCGGIVDTSNLVSWSEFRNHKNDAGAHVSPADRTRWNNRTTVSVGTVSKLNYGKNPTVTNVGTSENPVLNFGIPAGRPFTYDDFTPAQLEGLRGPQGDTGPAPDIVIGTVSTGADEFDGNVTLTPGPNGTLLLGFRLPKGPPMSFDDLSDSQKEELKGEQGDAAKTLTIRNVESLPPSDAPYMTKVSETGSEITFDVGIPRGYSPTVYMSAVPLAAGSSPSVSTTTNQSGAQSTVSFVLGVPAGDPGYIVLANAAYDSYRDRFSLADDTSNLVNVTGSMETAHVQLPSTYRSSREVGAHEFTMVLRFSDAWTGSTFAVEFTRYSSSTPMYLHCFSPATLDFTGAAPGDVVVVHFAEIFENHYLVSSKTLSTPVEVPYQ